MKKRITIAALAAAALGTAGFASASVLAVDGGAIQYGQSGATCDADGVKVNWGLETDTNTVSNARITGIDAACAGAELFVKVNGGAAKSATIPASIPANGVNLTGNFPSPADITDVQVWIEG